MNVRRPSSSSATDVADPPQGARYITLRLDVLSGLFKEMGELSHQRRFGLSVREVRLILQILHNPGLTMSQLVALTYMEKTLVSRAVTRLTQLGLVQRLVGAQDARHVQLQLTGNGDRVARQASGDVLQATGELFAELSDADQQAFGRTLDVLTARAEQRLEQLRAAPEQWLPAADSSQPLKSPKSKKVKT